MQALSEQLGVPLPELEQYFTIHPAHLQLEKGGLTPDEFLGMLLADGNGQVDLTVEELRNILGKSFAPNTPLLTTIDQFRPSLRVILLSNTNAIDIPYIENQFQLISWADDAVLSYEVGIRKPDHHIYQYTLHEFGLSGESTIFIDDKELNVLAARESGLQAEVYQSPEQVERLLIVLCR